MAFRPGHGAHGLLAGPELVPFRGVRGALNEDGHRVYETVVHPVDSVAERAVLLGKQIDEVLERTKATKVFPPELRRAGRRKLLYLHDAGDLKDLKVPPGNRLEHLKGSLKGFLSIRINDRWRVVFRWASGNAFDVQVIDYH